MSSTNKTSNYDLSQFIGTDKPAWLTDYNQDMAKIDAGIDAAQDTATGADGKADTANNNIGDMSYLSTTAKNTIVAAINEVDSHADGAVESASNANTVAQGAKSTADGIAAYLDISNVNASLTATTNGGATVDQIRFHSAYNATGTLGKIYGFMQIIKTNNQESTITISDTGLRPAEAFTISDGILLYHFRGTIMPTLFSADLTVKPDGTATFNIPGWTYATGDTTYIRAINQPYLIFAKKFDA